jgi:hypothetical protein
LVLGEEIFERTGQVRGGGFSYGQRHCVDDAQRGKRASSELLPAATLS